MASFKPIVKSVMKCLLPEKAFQSFFAVRSRKWQLNSFKVSGALLQVERYIEEHGTVVQSGPFAGMIFPLKSAMNRWVIPKLTGSYESEIHFFLEALTKRNYDFILDIGSAEGYYACGLARLFKVPVLAYDPEPYEKEFSRQIALRNGVDGYVKMADFFTVQDMEKFAGNRVLVVCDCEGYEEVLFRPETLAFTRNWDLIIELHGTADRALPALAWPHRTLIVDLMDKPGLETEHRSAPQRIILCDSQHAIAAP